MRHIAVLDTSVCTKNVGDQIIMESVREELRTVFPHDFWFFLQTHDRLGDESYKLLDRSDHAFVGGTNLLSSNMNSYNQWKIDLRDYRRLKDVILMGVGWWQYQGKPNWYTRKLFNKVLSSDKLHSVRDEYTKNQLRSLGMENVVNTACPTMWALTEEHCAGIPRDKTDSVLMTLTDYSPKANLDKRLFRVIERNYGKIYLWLQGAGDYDYARRVVGDASVEFVDPTLDALDEVLGGDEPVDYVGTRLHAGIRALRHGRRAAIVGIDNRATEKSRDLNLPVAGRQELDKLEQLITESRETHLRLPFDDINRWKEQFRRQGGDARD